MFATGVSLLVAASFASAGNDAQLKKGGIFRVGTTGASVQVDPQLAYVTTAWWLEYATAAKLYNYPDKKGQAGSKLVPEVASRFTVSDGGRTYTFWVRKGFRFSDGISVTAKNFKYAINRVANHDLASPGASFITDQRGTNIVGAQLPAAEVQGIANKYGVNKTRFWAVPVACTGWILFNTRAGLFAGNVRMRKAVNWALDRTAYAAQTGPYFNSPWTHLLPPGFPGSVTTKKLQPYAAKPNIARARALAAGHFRDGKIIVAYRSAGTIGPARAQLVRRDLMQLGFEPENITMNGYSESLYFLPRSSTRGTWP